MLVEGNSTANPLPSPESVLNRRERRALEMSIRRTRKEASKTNLPQAAALIPEEQILAREDDIHFLIKEEKQYRLAQTCTLMEISAYSALRQLGVADVICKEVIANPNLINRQDSAKEIFSQVRTESVEDGKLINHWETAFNAMRKYKKFCDPDETDLIRSLIKDDNISGGDILNEIIRARQESMGLIRMQIDWLKKRKVLASKQKKADQKIENTVEMDTGRKTEEKLALAALQNVQGWLPEISMDSNREAEEPFLLKGWDLFVTKSSPLSSDNPTAPNHLISIPTNSRQETLGTVTTLTQGKASIKPNSILNALEFHLRKDVIQKALSSKNKYGPEGIRDWVKIKRGRDRIFLFIPNPDETRVIFFVEGRDIIYRSN